MTDSQVFFNGDVYSPSDPFATALSFADGVVKWIGSDEAALAQTQSATDLHEDFVAPGFVASGLDLRTENVTAHDLVPAGITFAHVIGTEQDIADFRAASGDLRVIGYALDSSQGPGACAAADLDLGAEADRTLFLTVDDHRDWSALQELLGDAERMSRARLLLWRIRVAGVVPAEWVDPLCASGLALSLDPTEPGQPLSSLLAGGAQVSFLLDPRTPWRSVRAAVYELEQGVSGRAAFNCATRFAHRAGGNPEGGTLVFGSAADAVRWHTAGLVVQVADSRVAAWSTDPRSGTPGLPDLSDPAALPTPVTVFIGGVEQHLA